MTNSAPELIHFGGVWMLKLAGSTDDKDDHLTWLHDHRIELLQELTQVQAQELVIDLTATENLGSQGLVLLIGLHKEFSQHNIQLVLYNPQSYLSRILRIMQLDKLFVVEWPENFSPPE